MVNTCYSSCGSSQSVFGFTATSKLGQWVSAMENDVLASLVYVPKLVVAKCDNSYLPDFLCGRWSFGVVLYEIFTMGRYFMNSALLFV